MSLQSYLPIIGLASVLLAPRLANAAAAPAQAGPDTVERDESGTPERAFFRLRLDKQRLYEGESVPFTARAYFRADTSVTTTGAPTLANDAFLVSGLDQAPKQTQTVISGEPYLVVTWSGVLTAVKPGAHPLALTLPVTLQYREASAEPQTHQPTLRDLFGDVGGMSSMFRDPFFDSMLDQPAFPGFAQLGRTVSREVVLRAEGPRIAIQPLPTAGRPADFGGAVGQFELEAKLEAPALVQGEPADLQVQVRGSGNFGRFAAPSVADTPAWTAYAAQSRFSAEGAGLRGTLRVAQPLIARTAGMQTLPGVRFSYFDPLTARYVTKSTPTRSVQVTPAAFDSDTRAQGASTAPRVKDTPALSVRTLASGGVPSWVWPVALSSLWLGLGAAALIRASRSTHARVFTERFMRRQRARRQRKRLWTAVARRDAAAALRAGRTAVQQQLAAAWRVRPESITAVELEARWPAVPAPVRELFELADRADYAGAPLRWPEQNDLHTWAKRLERATADMKVPS